MQVKDGRLKVSLLGKEWQCQVVLRVDNKAMPEIIGLDCNANGKLFPFACSTLRILVQWFIRLALVDYTTKTFTEVNDELSGWCVMPLVVVV